MNSGPAKVVFLTYFYPPCSLTAANRVSGWVKHLNREEVEPVVITRNWEQPIGRERDVALPSGTTVEIKTENGAEVHTVPFKPLWRDRLITGPQYFFVAPLRRLLSMMERWLGRWIPSLNPSHQVGEYALDYLRQHPEVRLLVVSGNPFQLYYYGWRAQRELGVSWVADYRDDWSTNLLVPIQGWFARWMRNLDRRTEQRWVGSAAAICSVSEEYVERISTLTGRPGFTVMNGFNAILAAETPPKNKEFTLLYNGSLYWAQPLESFLLAWQEAVAAFPEVPWKLVFLGLSYSPSQVERVKQALPREMWSRVEFSPRIPVEQALERTRQADVLLMLTYRQQGIPSSKLFDYLAAGRPVLAYPNDKDIIERIVLQTRIGSIADNDIALKNQLQAHLQAWKERGQVAAADTRFVEMYSRQAQTELLLKNIRPLLQRRRTWMILCNDYPPLNTVAAERPSAWVADVLDMGENVVLVTKKWTGPQTHPSFWEYGGRRNIEQVKEGNLTQILVPNRMVPTDWLMRTFPKNQPAVLRKAVTAVWNLGSWFYSGFDRHAHLYSGAAAYLSANQADVLVATGNPFQNFRHAYRLHRKFGIPWVADYRDGWYLNQETIRQRGGLAFMLRQVEWRKEQKYLSSAAMITAASPALAEFYTFFFNRKVFTLFNGYRDIPEARDGFRGNAKQLWVHNGTLKSTQDVEFVLDAIVEPVKRGQLKPGDLELRFVGLGHFPEQWARVWNRHPELQPFLSATPRLPREESLQHNLAADALLAISDPAYNNIYAKVFDYIGCGRPILVAPNDPGLMNRLVEENGFGRVCYEAKDLFSIALGKEKLSLNMNNEERKTMYQRRTQSQRLRSLVGQQIFKEKEE